MVTRLEIFKNNQWIKLVLKVDSIKYNTLSNKIGNFEQRRISHSDTFSLPYVSDNIIALDINVFSPILIAEALNRKYLARYFVRDKLLQSGYLVINNTVQGEINVNFIDEALVITDEWGRITFKQLLGQLGDTPENFPKSVISSSFMDNINILKNYTISKTERVLNTPSCFCSGDDPSIDGKEVFITRYPNPLNSIGDKFNIDKDGIRKLDSFNPYQSRPIFSIFSFIYIICQAYGYKLKLDSSVDFELLRDTYLTSKAVEESTPIEESFVTSTTTTISEGPSNYWNYDKHGIGTGDNEGWFEMFFLYPNNTPTVDEFGKKIGVASLTPSQIGYVPSHVKTKTISPPLNYRCIVKIETDSFIGNVIWTADILPRTPLNRFSFNQFVAYSIWDDGFGNEIESVFNVTTETVGRSFTATGDKSQLNNTPPGGVTFIGLIFHVIVRHEDEWYNDVPKILNMHFVEQVLPKGKVEFDAYGQYLASNVNLLNLSPDTSVKELLSNVLQQQGLLLTFDRDSNGVQNIVKLFTYGSYRNRVYEARNGELGKFYDWSEYHQKLVPPLFNTDYGTQYGEVNEISLSNPFSGNVGKIKISTNLTSKGYQTKLIPLVQNKTKSLDDISLVTTILNTDPYFEYTHKTQGLVKCSFDLYLPGTRLQYNAELAVSTIFSDPLPLVSNVIYSDDFLPIGIKEWYYLIDVAVKGQATFLLPISVIRNFDISLPVYVVSLGGFYIVEEIGEYTDNLTVVKVDLIKLPL